MKDRKKQRSPRPEIQEGITDQEIREAVKTLKHGGTLLYPTDTIYGVGCDATDAEAVDKIYALKERDLSKSLLVLVDGPNMLERYVQNIPEMAWDLIEMQQSALTLVYDDAKGVAENVVAHDGSLAVRITSDPLCLALLRKLKKPIVSTSANLSGEASPTDFASVSEAIKDRVDYVLEAPLASPNTKPSTIIKLSADNSFKILRK